MTNQEDLLSNDTDLLVSGDSEANYEDSVLEMGKSERYDYKIVDQAIWDFLKTRYGGTAVKRFYRNSAYGQSSCDVRLTAIPLILGLPENFKEFTKNQTIPTELKFLYKKVAISNSKGYGDLKKRIALCLTHFLGHDVSVGMLRLWKTENKVEQTILAEMKQVAQQAQTNAAPQ